MKHKIVALSVILLTAALFHQAAAQTKCIWMVKSINGEQVQKIAVSVPLVKFFASEDGNFDINGEKISYKSLMETYRDGSIIEIKDSTDNGVTKVYGGKFDQDMKESSDRNDRLFMESSDKGGEPKVSQMRVKSVEAVSILLAMIGSKDLDKDIDGIESVLEQGGVLYVRDNEKDSRLWIYVN
ncbi:MAG: hypothetical protein WAV76_12820 [Bacteroidota bacterium]